MTCFLVAPDQRDPRVRSLSALLSSLGHPVTVASALDGVRTERAAAGVRRTLIVVPETAGGPAAPDVVAFAREMGERVFVVYVAAGLAPELYKALVRSRAGEWVGWDTCAEELRDLAKAFEGTAQPVDQSGRIVSFLPSKGGVGNTTLVLETAVQLATRRRPVRVALLDLNLQGGTMADALDVEPRFDVMEIVTQPERLDEQLIDVFTSRHAPRLDIFAGPARRLALEDIPPQIIFTFIDAIAKRYEAVLIDLPRVWGEWVDTILQGSDAVVVSGGATVPALRCLTHTLSHLDTLKLPAQRLAVAVNACDTDLLGRIVRRREIERPFADRSVFCIRRDSAATGALDAGRSLLEMAPNARASRDIRRLAEWCGTAAALA